MTDRPENVSQYRKWLLKRHGVRVDIALQNYYETVVSRLRNAFLASDLWKQLAAGLAECDDKYLARTGYPLLLTRPAPELRSKPFDSYILKTFRKNVLSNDLWPEPPKQGWVLPGRDFSRVTTWLEPSLWSSIWTDSKPSQTGLLGLRAFSG